MNDKRKLILIGFFLALFVMAFSKDSSISSSTDDKVGFLSSVDGWKPTTADIPLNVEENENFHFLDATKVISPPATIVINPLMDNAIFFVEENDKNLELNLKTLKIKNLVK